MTLKTSLIITGDASVAKKAVEDLHASVKALATGAKAAAPATQQLDKAQADLAGSAKDAAASTEKLDAAQKKGAGTARDLAQASEAGKAAQTGLGAAAQAAATAQAAQTQALTKTADETRKLTAANDGVAASGAAVKQQLTAIEAAQGSAATGADAHAAAMKGLQGEVGAIVAAVAGGQSVFDAMAEHGDSIAAALTAVAAAGGSAKAGIDAAGESGKEAGTDLGGLADSVSETAGKFEGMGGKLGSVAGILAGPVGAGIGLVVSALGGLVGSLIETYLESDKVEEGALELVDALDKQKAGTDAARAAIDAYNDQQERQRKSNDLAHRDALRAAEDSYKQALATRQETQALLAKREAQAKAAFDAQPGGGEGGVGVEQSAATAAVSAVKRQLADNQKQIDRLEQTIRNQLIEIGGRRGAAAADGREAINLKYDLQILAAEKAAAANTKLARVYDLTTKAIEEERAAKLKKYDEEHREGRKPREVSLGNQIEANSAASILASAQRFKGASESVAADRVRLRDLFGEAKLNLDPAVTAWCAAFVNGILAEHGIKGTGDLSARSFLGFGQSTDSPNKGDIVVTKRGNNPAQGHVGFYQGTDAKGNILVLGGNTGNRVGTQAVARNDVLGFRRAPTAAEAYKDSQKAAEDAQKAAIDAAKEQERALDQVIAKYLPATAAAKEYADELARIDALAKSYDGKNATSGLTAEQANAARTALTEAHNKRLAEINLTPEAKAADEARKSIDGVIASLGEELAARQALDPVQRAMAEHQAELAKLSDEERAAYEAKLRSLYEQDEAYRAVEDATRAAAAAQAELRDMALDAFDTIVLGGQSAGKVIDQLAKRIASAAIEAAVLGTGPLAALLKGGGSVAAGAGGGAGQAAADLVGKSVGKNVGDKLSGLFGKGGSGGAAAGQLLQSAGLGYTAAGILGGNKLGGAFGGALGGAIAGPLGSIAGGIVGGVVGKLIAGKPKEYGSAAISIEGGVASAGAAIGKGSAEREKASALGGSVADGLNRIAQALGGELGSASVSIGYRPGHKAGAYRVDTSGGGRVTGVEAFATEAEAIAFAIRDAIADGGVKGLSDAVQRALQSSTDLDKAVAEASKVQALEELIGGVTSTIDKAFREFETTAKERVRLATQYGFDLVAIEKRNGEDRVKLAEQLSQQQVGSLKKLIEEMEQGSLFEGSALDKITALNKSIDKAKADLAAGVDGAADTLTALYQQKLAAAKDAYGTTGAYAADRSSILDDARNAIAASNARILSAQQKTSSDPALAATNAALDENNDQNAQVIATLKETNALLSSIASAGSSGGTFSNLQQLAHR